MTRRKVLAKREKNGRPQRQTDPDLVHPAEIKRLMDASLSGMRDPMWGTQLGRLCLMRKITTVQFSAGRHWGELAADYGRACGSPRPPASPRLERTHGHSPDPDSAKGRREAARHMQWLEDYETGCRALVDVGPRAAKMVQAVCEHNLAAHGADLEALKAGLQSLAVMWQLRSSQPKPKR